MPADDYTDDYVADLLRRDAKATSSAASNLGLGSLLNKRPTSSAPKPNTRFLKNLIRDTDTHNAALLAKEAEESKARLRKLREEKVRQKRRPEQTLYSARARHDGTAAAPPPSKRRRVSDDQDELSKLREKDRGSSRRDHDADHERSTHRRSRHDGEDHPRDRRDRRRSRSRTLDRHEDEEKDSRSSRRHDGHRHRRHRTRSPDLERDREHRDRRHRSRSPARRNDKRPSHRSRRSSSADSLDHRKPSRCNDEKASSSRHHKRNERHPSPASDSDPLEAILGPTPPPAQPPLRSKGRGAFNPSTIDAHFSSSYDPSADVTPDPASILDDNDDDWEGALEALRDRQKWRQQGAERLRAAGFSEEEVKKWANQKVNAQGERVMDEADVRWNKKGEGREWDRGKVVDEEDGTVDLMPEWGRLKGT